jgi:GAF domain-containing protein
MSEEEGPMSKPAVIAASVRYAVAALALAAYVWLLGSDALYTFPQKLHTSSFIMQLAEYGASALVSFLFLAVGALAILSIRQRLAGFLLFAFSLLMMVTFTQETASVLGSPGPSVLAGAMSTLAMFLLATLLLVFPHNYFTRRAGQASRPGIRPVHVFFASQVALMALSLAADPLVTGFITHGHLVSPASAGGGLPDLTDLLALLSLLSSSGTIFVTFRRSSSPQERQQAGILAMGMLLGIGPFLILTLLPSVVTGGSHSPFVVPAQFSTVSMGLIAVALGYAILRYHLLVVDRHIRKIITLLVGGICLAVAAYLAFFTSSILLPNHWAQVKWCIAGLFLLLVPTAWRSASWVTGRLFAPDLAFAHHLLYGQREATALLNVGDSALEAVASKIMQAARPIFGTPRLCFFVLHRESGAYHLVQPPWHGGEVDTCERTLFSSLGVAERAQEGWLDAREPIFARLASARRPLYLSKALSPHRTRTVFGTSRLLASPTVSDDPLLVPVMARGGQDESELMGILLLGRRDNHQPYAGPDFELCDLLLLRFSWMLGHALAEAQSREHLAMLNALYSTTSTAIASPRLADDIAQAYAGAAASALQAGAEVWLYDSQAQSLHRAARAGEGPRLPYGERLQPGEANDWLSWFYEGAALLQSTELERTRPSILEPPTFPFAWLPLVRGDPLGVLVLTYQRPHRHFSPAERQVLEIFAHQLAGSLENARVAANLRAATNEQRAQDRLKSQATKGSLQGLLRTLLSLERYTAMLQQISPPSASGGEQVPLVLAREPAPAPVPSLAWLDAFIASIGASLAQLYTLATTHSGEPSTVPARDSLLRREVNAILSGFDNNEADRLVLVIAPDPDFRALLCTALDLYGYTWAEAATTRQAVGWMGENRVSGSGPAAVLLHHAALGERPVSEFTRELRQAAETRSPLPPLILLGGSNHPQVQDHPSYRSVELPFSVHSLVECLQTCLPKRSSGED